jgi:hypothetical protein
VLHFSEGGFSFVKKFSKTVVLFIPESLLKGKYSNVFKGTTVFLQSCMQSSHGILPVIFLKSPLWYLIQVIFLQKKDAFQEKA